MSEVGDAVSVSTELGKSGSTPRLGRVRWTLTEATERTTASRSTLRRRLSAGAFPNASHDAGGTWLIPVEDLIAAGITLVKTPAHEQPNQDPDELGEPAQEEVSWVEVEVARLRHELSQERARAELERARRLAAEQVAVERERHLSTALASLRMLEATAAPRPSAPEVLDLRDPVPSQPVPEPARTATTQSAQSTAVPRRRWWQRH